MRIRSSKKCQFAILSNFSVDFVNVYDKSKADMIEATQFKTPGQLIQALLDERGWSQRVLAVVLKVSETGINKIISGKQPLDAAMALALAGIFGVPAEKFLALQQSYELAQARFLFVEDPAMATRAELFGKLPVAEMIKRGWLDADDVRNFTKVEAALTKFFGVPSVKDIEIFPHAAKKTNVFGSATDAQLVWLYRVKQIADEMLVARYSPSAVQSAVTKLKELLVSPVAARKVSRILAEAGIRFVIVESLPGAKIDGVCFWMDAKNPVIGMSLRFDRIDNFWFVLRHELEHVIQLHGLNEMMLDVELEGERAGVGKNVAEEERLANKAAADFCVPQKNLQNFISRKSPVFYDRDIIGFAITMKVHPGLVAGQLRHKLHELGFKEAYSRFSNHLVKIRSIVAPGATMDGWGNIVPVG
jgi:HTH-type transcriptional regulator/antitoxin HigA